MILLLYPVPLLVPSDFPNQWDRATRGGSQSFSVSGGSETLVSQPPGGGVSHNPECKQNLASCHG